MEPEVTPLVTVLDRASVEVAVVDADGTIVYTNDAWRAFGEDNANPYPESVGENYLEACLAGEADPGALAVHDGLTSLFEGERSHFRSTYPCHAPDERRWFDVYACRFEVDGTPYALMLHTNVTERTDADVIAREETERLEALTRMLTHDFRTSLSVAQGYVRLLEHEVDSPHLEPLRSALVRLGGVVEDAVTLAESADVTELEWVSLHEAAHRVWGGLGTDEPSLTVVDEPRVEADPQLLDRLLENLFENALVHAGDAVAVTVGELDASGFYVADDGPGIPEADREMVFRCGYTTGGGGTGFGLDIVRRIVEAHDWTISVVESESGGVRFEVRT